MPNSGCSTKIIGNTNKPPGGDRSEGFQLRFYIFSWILIDSVLKLILYAPRLMYIERERERERERSEGFHIRIDIFFYMDHDF